MAATHMTDPYAEAKPALLRANIEAVSRRNPELARELASATPYPVGDHGIRFEPTPQGVPSISLEGRALASRRRPLDEAKRLADRIDLKKYAVVAVLGFGVGHHVKHLAESVGKAGVVIALEPDVRLLRTLMERIDYRWLDQLNVVIVHDPEDGPYLSSVMQGAESLIAQGVAFCDHPPSRERLGDAAALFSRTVTDLVAAMRMTITTTLVQMSSTMRNTLVNLRQYVGGEGVADLQGHCTGAPAIIVAAGPSLERNIDLLTEPGVSDRFVIIAVQTVLKTLLARGIRPHFVTALDYHEISKRFYEGLTAADVEGVQLVCEPKANPAILDAFPGAIRCVRDGFADAVLGPALAREMGQITPGATVAHLCFYFAQYLGCDPIILIGQDLGFTDGLYYAPNNPIHHVWGPELGPFNTVEVMEWQRIVRGRNRLRSAEDQQGRSMYTDDQMHTYQQQFERDFADAPQTVIDATEGGTRKKHTEVMTLRQAIDQHAGAPLPPIAMATVDLDTDRIAGARDSLAALRRDVQRIIGHSRDTIDLLRKMESRFDDRQRFNTLLGKVEKKREEVHRLERAFAAVNYLNQAGTFRRLRADRAIQMEDDLSPLDRQRRQLERDIQNVEWIVEAAEELTRLVDLALDRLDGRPLTSECVRNAADPTRRRTSDGAGVSVAAVIAIDDDDVDALRARPLEDDGDRRTVLQYTLDRLADVDGISRVIILASSGDAIADLHDAALTRIETIVHACGHSPLGDRRAAVRAARCFNHSSWRGGIGGLTAYDEVLAPHDTLAALAEHDIDSALIVGADWTMLDPKLCSDIVGRRRAEAKRLPFVFSQAPPGLAGIVLSRPVIEQIANAGIHSSFGAIVGYLPMKPQADPIVHDHCYKTDQRVRQSLHRATWGALPRDFAMESMRSDDHDAASVVERLEHHIEQQGHDHPAELRIELTTARLTRGPAACSPEMYEHAPQRDPMAPEVFDRLMTYAADCGAVVTLTGLGDPLLHGDVIAIMQHARDAGVRHLHVQSDLLAADEVLDATGDLADVVSVNLSADRAATYENAMGVDRFREALLGVQRIMKRRRPVGQFRLPWIVPRLVRCDETYEDIETFYDRWMMDLGAALIEPMHREHRLRVGQSLRPAVCPEHVAFALRSRVMTVLSDGSIVADPDDWTGRTTIANASTDDLAAAWRTMQGMRTHD
jgi:hypothetical protein